MVIWYRHTANSKRYFSRLKWDQPQKYISIKCALCSELIWCFTLPLRAAVNTLLLYFVVWVCFFCYTFVLRSKWNFSGTCQIRWSLKLLCLSLSMPSLLWLVKSYALNHVLKIACRPAGNFYVKCCSFSVDMVVWCLLNSPWWMCSYRTDEKVGRPHVRKVGVLTSEHYVWWWCLTES